MAALLTSFPSHTRVTESRGLFKEGSSFLFYQAGGDPFAQTDANQWQTRFICQSIISNTIYA